MASGLLNPIKGKRLIGLMAFLIIFLFSPLYIQAAPTEEEKVINAIAKVKPSVVNITTSASDVTGNTSTGSGSGVIISSDGYILTNYHVIKGATNINVIIHNGKQFHAVVYGESTKNDLAIIKINATGLPAIQWGDSKNLKIGQSAIAIGNPYKFEWSVSRGIVSALNRNISAGGIRYIELIQTDAAINRGNSGGALIDTSGKVIGINTLVYRGEGSGGAQGLGFAIPSHRAKVITEQILAKKVYVSAQPWIGISGIDITQEIAESNLFPVNCGVLVTKVEPVSPAQAAGIQKGDIVSLLNGKLVANVAVFKQYLAESTPGETLELTIWRDDVSMIVKVKVSQRSYKP